MKKITIRSRLGECEGVTDGLVAAFDYPDSVVEGRLIRHYVLLDKGIKLMFEPWGWHNRWYADLVEIKKIDETIIEVTDLYIDIIIEGDGPTYRLIDLDDLGEAFATGVVRPEEMAEPLRNLQRFLDDHIHDDKDFPPKCIQPFFK